MATTRQRFWGKKNKGSLESSWLVLTMWDYLPFARTHPLMTSVRMSMGRMWIINGIYIDIKLTF